ncbi:MAG: hypothetical protein LUE86_06900 [Clostridiales bacterium]|nr:hypothetical protein [Clostridiales bacterium]
MQATVICSQGNTSFSYDGSESSLWEGVGKLLRWVKAPDTLTVLANGEQAVIEVGDTLKPVSNHIKAAPSRYEKKWLTVVDPETNGYSFYKIMPNNMGSRTLSVGGSYGRMGTQKGDLSAETVIRPPYPSYLYWLKYYDKINHGYRDMGDIMFAEDTTLDRFTPTDEEDPVSDSVVLTLYKTLRQFAKDSIASQIDVDFLSEAAPFTKKQVEKGWKIWKSLGESRDVDDFNRKVEELLALSPRKIDPYRGMTVASFLAKPAATKEEQQKIFADIIAREESLLMAMEAVTNMMPSRRGKEDIPTSPFGDIDISLAEEEEKHVVTSMLDNRLSGYVKNVYRVCPHVQQEKFNAYVALHQISDIRLFWHGSRNENWISIIRNSLMLNPNAVITGKMWGSGIYFAPSSHKSWGYTSWYGSKWANGTQQTAFMGVYATAYGTPYCPTQLVSGSKALLAQEHANCLHAKRDVANLYADEVVFFDEDAVCLQYLVEFTANQ